VHADKSDLLPSLEAVALTFRDLLPTSNSTSQSNADEQGELFGDLSAPD
jgi:hypothetical protein